VALRATQPIIKWAPGALSLRVQQLGCEVDHSAPSSADDCIVWCLITLRINFMACYFFKNRDNFTFTFMNISLYNQDLRINCLYYIMKRFYSYPSTRGTSFKMRLTTCKRASRRREERSSRASGTPTPTPKAAATIRRPQTANHCLQSSSSTAAEWSSIISEK